MVNKFINFEEAPKPDDTKNDEEIIKQFEQEALDWIRNKEQEGRGLNSWGGWVLRAKGDDGIVNFKTHVETELHFLEASYLDYKKAYGRIHGLQGEALEDAFKKKLDDLSDLAFQSFKKYLSDHGKSLEKLLEGDYSRDE
jgi:hypothetical protein